MDRHNRLLKKDKGDDSRLKIGQSVLIWKPKIIDGKLSRLWEEPYKVKAKRDRHSYVISDPKTRKLYNRHRRHLRPLPRITDAPSDPDPELNENLTPQNVNANATTLSIFEHLPFFAHCN